MTKKMQESGAVSLTYRSGLADDTVKSDFRRKILILYFSLVQALHMYFGSRQLLELLRCFRDRGGVAS